MFDVDSAAKYTLKVTVEDVTRPVDLITFLQELPSVKVYEGVSEAAIDAAPVLLYVVPEGGYEVGKLFTAIEDKTEKWFESRTDTVTVEVHRPDGHLQVLAKSAG
jgi:hypothetical protein